MKVLAALGPSEDSEEESVPWVSPGSRGFAGSVWLIDASFPSLPSSLHGFLLVFFSSFHSLSVNIYSCVQILTFISTTVILD